ncbi:MAG: pyrroline-5-carboxylate reductase [Campylobacter sp.]|nr:pyrroline-5-carboxylate reductase [Campylobacter sp.]
MKIAFIGGGNMGSAMIAGLIASKNFRADEILLYARSRTAKLVKNFGVIEAKNELELTQNADIIVLAVKPNVYESVIKLIKPAVKDQIFISLAPNFTLQALSTMLKTDKIVRAMPNTPALVGKATSGLCFGQINEEQKAIVRKIFSSFGEIFEIEEGKFAIFTAIAGSLPAMIFKLVEAAADGGVRGGISRQMAYDILANVVLGSAQMLKSTHKHPGVLKDEVASPAGTTIQMLAKLDEMGFSNAILQAIKACEDKAK